MDRIEKAAHKIKGFYHSHRRMPSFSEVATLFGYASKMASHRLIEKLIAREFIEKDSKGKLLPTPQIGLRVLGYVQAGFPSPAEEELIDTLSFDEYLISHPDKSFLLKVTGDSMLQAAILPNDLVIIEKGVQPKNGHIVLAQVDREWTLKYFQKQKN